MCDLNQCGNRHNLPPITLDAKSRRAFLKGAISLPLATVLAYPELAAAQAQTLETVQIDVGGAVSAALARPASKSAPAVVLIHEWWGLNDQIKSVAAELAKVGYLALAVDLYGGTVATDRDGAMAAMKAVDAEHANATLAGWINWLKQAENGGNGKVATMGWCFGGGWSLNASVNTAVDATIIYYGRVTQPAEALAKLKGPVLGHFGTLDKSINAEMVAGFEAELEKAGKTAEATIHWYEADHAFANPTGARYDEPSAELSWQRTLEFLSTTLDS